MSLWQLLHWYNRIADVYLFPFAWCPSLGHVSLLNNEGQRSSGIAKGVRKYVAAMCAEYGNDGVVTAVLQLYY